MPARQTRPFPGMPFRERPEEGLAEISTGFAARRASARRQKPCVLPGQQGPAQTRARARKTGRPRHPPAAARTALFRKKPARRAQKRRGLHGNGQRKGRHGRGCSRKTPKDERQTPILPQRNPLAIRILRFRGANVKKIRHDSKPGPLELRRGSAIFAASFPGISHVLPCPSS